MADGSGFRDYQSQALNRLKNNSDRFSSLVMPTGSGKTRVALKYAEEGMKEGDSVAYIVRSDAHAEQVIRESEKVGIQAKFIPGKNSDKATNEREYKIDDYSAGFHIGVFTYSGYFLGGGVEAARKLIIDDAHAIRAQDLSHSTIEINKSNWNKEYDRILLFLKDENPQLAPQIESLEVPVHRGGNTILVPPPRNKQAADDLRERLTELTEGTGWHKHFLNNRLNSSPHFPYWPCVVTLNSIRWRPFILPFESLGSDPRGHIQENEILALTSTKDSENLLQERMGLSEPISEIQPDEALEMGRRIVVSYPKYNSAVPPSNTQLNIISEWVDEFGSVLVSVSSDESHTNLERELGNEISVLRYRSDESLDDFEELSEPKVLVLVNRPSGIDIHSSICEVAIHLDLPYSASGHETVAGDIEETGTVADASLAVRLSQLLGRLNRQPDHRSFHILLGGELPIDRDSVFVKTLDPTILLDLLIGKFGIHREYELPVGEELMDMAKSFLSGDDSPRRKHLERAETVRERYLADDVQSFSPDRSARVEANLYAARGNFSSASKEFSSFAQDADIEGFESHASFFDLQSLGYSLGVQRDPEAVLERQFDAVVEEALNRNPASGTIVSALNQLQSDDVTEGDTLGLSRLDMKNEAQYSYRRWIDSYRDDIPESGERNDEEVWKKYWINALTEPDHSDLQDTYCKIFELLGTGTPKQEVADNDAKIVWEHRDRDNYKLAMEVKGWDPVARDTPPEVEVGDVEQARDNARDIDANSVLLATSRRGRERLVPQKAEELGVHIIRDHNAKALAGKMALQCVALHKYSKGIIGKEKIPFVAIDFEKLLDEQDGGTIDSQEIKDVM